MPEDNKSPEQLESDMKLYTDFAWVCHEIYAHTFDYAATFKRYNSLFRTHNCKHILELACGTGLLARHFVSAGYNYTGIDLYDGMLAIARNFASGGRFLQGDMRTFASIVDETWDAVLVAGRGFYHLATNADVLNCLSSVRRVLHPGGVFTFEAFDAVDHFTNFKSHGHRTIFLEDMTFKRKVRFQKLLDTGWTERAYEKYIVEKGESRFKFKNVVVIRAFLPDELALFLRLSGFKMISCTPLEETPSILLTVAQKIGNESKGSQG